MTKPFDSSQQFTSADVSIISEKPLYQGFFKMVKYAFKHKLFAGGWSDVIEREIFERGHAVAVLLFDPVLDEFVMIEQIRIGALPTAQSPWLLEVVAGVIDQGETPESVSIREAQEEAGVEVTKLTKALSYLSSPGGTTERIHIFVGCVDASQAQGIHGLDYEGEDILVHRIATEDAFVLLDQQKIDNAATLIALQWFALNKQKIEDAWRDE